MIHWKRKRTLPLLLLLCIGLAFVVSACNLTSAPQEQLDLTDVPTSTALPSRTPVNTFPTPITVTALPGVPTSRPTSQLPPTSIGVLPTFSAPFPSSTPLPVNILIFSPVPGNVVAGNVQVLGAASHPQFLQYQLEYGPDPNPGNVWFPASGVVQLPIINGLLGIWNTTASQDGLYQLRLRVYLRDGTSLATVVNQIRVQNRAPTPVPTNTTIPRPIAAFTQDRISGQAPLVVNFFNQSSGNITNYSWDFGDGSTSPAVNPRHTFRNPGIYTVRLRVTGPGGRSNVSREIVVQGSAPPVAAFTQDRTSGQAPLTVQFTDRSTGNITARLWNFGDGTTSNETNPSHTFNAVGNYNVLLTVTGPGGSSSVRRQITVENPTIPEPIAALVASPVEGQAPLTVQFDASDSSGQIDTYNWAFGDGEFGEGQIVTHTYSQAGTYEAELIVVGPGGQASRTATITVTQPPDAPVAAFTANPESGNIPLTVQFDATASTGQINTYAWDFGDGETGTGATVSHIYDEVGTYTVQLTVTGPGGENSVTHDVSATEPILPPEAAFEASPSSGTAPLEVQFVNQTEGDGLTFEWNFGDNSPVNNETDPLHTYENPGEYQVVLTVTGEGGSDTAEMLISVTSPAEPPVANFSASPESGSAPLEVQFVNQTAGENLTFEWNFGDNSPVSNEPNPQHTYTEPGNYTATLTVTGPGGQSNATRVINVSEEVVIVPPTASFTANPTEGDAPLTVQFEAAQSDDITSYVWDFGDGLGNASGPTATYTYNTPGTYAVTLLVNGPGGSNTATTTISVSAPLEAPVANFMANPTEGEAPLEVVFDASISSGQIDSYSWNFGDGSEPGIGITASHVYNTPGAYTVELTVSGPGGSNTATTTINVGAPAPEAPVASFTASPTEGEAPLEVIFDASASTGQIDSYSWNFGDNTDFGSGVTTNHAYSAPGSYTVTLSITGPGGTNTSQTTINVTAPPVEAPVASFTANPTEGEAPLEVIFDASASTGQIDSFTWNFGDGTEPASGVTTNHVYNTPGAYTVELTVSGPGGMNTSQTTINVTAPPVEAPVASFTASPTEGEAPLEVIFDASASTGQIDSYSWNFGDDTEPASGVTTNHVYNTPGSYTAILVVTGPGGESQAETVINVTEPAPPESDIVGETPILPNLQPENVRQALRRIYDNGVSRGNRANVFAIIGDDLALQSGYLAPLADPGLNNDGSGLQPLIDWYRQTDLGNGRNSFDRRSTAAQQGWLARDLLDPNRSDPSVCNPGETPIDCELRLVQPAVAVISVGYADMQNNTNPAEFRGYMEQIIRAVINQGVIPVVSTVQPYPPDPARVNAINTAIIEAARQVETADNTAVPVYNLWLDYTNLPNNGLEADNFTPTIANSGAGNLNDNPVSRFGINARNRHVMDILNALRNTIYPDAP